MFPLYNTEAKTSLIGHWRSSDPLSGHYQSSTTAMDSYITPTIARSEANLKRDLPIPFAKDFYGARLADIHQLRIPTRIR